MEAGVTSSLQRIPGCRRGGEGARTRRRAAAAAAELCAEVSAGGESSIGGGEARKSNPGLDVALGLDGVLGPGSSSGTRRSSV
jgi:hypothetical protein